MMQFKEGLILTKEKYMSMKYHIGRNQLKADTPQKEIKLI